MSGLDILVDLAEGKTGIDIHLDGNNLYVSVISEIELLGWHKITLKQKSFFQTLLRDCFIVGLTKPVKELVIELKQKQKIRLPDSVIAASAIHLDIPLITRDREFSKIKGLSLRLIQ
ncbi:MAG: type II toxin-antitoxin system VapC family toxin [Flammeovirgaceae bacterium]|nr:MAG: type II toxin-antitoxin system VapC family toxin [Flammeovirgaceae bacterium]